MSPAYLKEIRENVYLVGRNQAMFGKNIIITDNTEWLTGDIIEASLAHWQVEDRYRPSKDDMRHLHCVLSVKKGSRTPERRLETPSNTQGEVLSAFGYHLDGSGDLQGPAR